MIEILAIASVVTVLAFTGPGRKIRRALFAQFNKVANKVQAVDPIAQMQYEVDQKTEQVRDGRLGLEKYRGLIERVKNQVGGNRQHVANLHAQVKSYLAVGDRQTAARFAVELETAERELADNEAQLKVHQTTYENNLQKVKFATQKIGELRNRVVKKDAELRFSRVEKEIASLGEALNFDTTKNGTTDLGAIEQVIQNEIDSNRASVQVAADLSGTGLDEIHHNEDVERQRAEAALQAFEAKHEAKMIGS